MSLVDDNPLKSSEPNLDPQLSDSDAPSFSAEPPPPPLSGDPISYAAATPPFKASSLLPEDLRISWSWTHLVVFLVFGFGKSAPFCCFRPTHISRRSNCSR